MKNRIIMKRNWQDKMSSFFSEIISANESILRGAFWGIALAALLLAMRNAKASHDMAKRFDESIIGLENDLQLVPEEVRTNVESDISAELDQRIADYIQEYISSNNIAEFFTEETKEAITADVQSRIINNISENSSLSSVQEKEIRDIISEKISQLDYATIENEIMRKLEGASMSSAEDLDALKQQINKTITGQISDTVVSISGEINAKYADLLVRINKIESHISDEPTKQVFQYGIDAKSGAAGYYYNGEWKPF